MVNFFPSLPPRWSHAAALLRTSWHLGHRTFHLGLSTFLWSVLAAWWLLGTSVLIVRYGVLPNAHDYLPRIERQASMALGLPVEIGSIEANWRGWRPEVTLTNIRIKNRQQQTVLEVPRVHGTLLWWTVPLFSPSFAKLDIDSPDMDITRLDSHRWRISGIDIDLDQRHDNRFSTWLLEQREVTIRGARIQYRDELRGAPMLELQKIAFSLRNNGRRHRFSLQATPPENIASALDLRGDFVHRYFHDNKADWREWTGEMYVNFDYADVKALEAYISLPLELYSARGAVRAWVSVDRGKLDASVADLGLEDVRLRLGKNLPILTLHELRSRVHLRQLEQEHLQGHELKLAQLTLVAGDNLSVPPTNISERLLFDAHGNIAAGEFSVDQVDLKSLLALADYLPLPNEQRLHLKNYAPAGILKNTQARWSGPLTHPVNYSASTNFEQLRLKAQSPDPTRPPTTPHHINFGQPGFENLAGSLRFNERGGALSLKSPQAVLFFPGVFAREHVALDALSLEGHWQHQTDGVHVQIDTLAVANYEAAGSFSGKWRPGDKGGWMEIEGRLQRANAQAVHHYLPLTISEDVRQWVKHAVQGGKSDDVHFVVRGNLHDWPYHQTGAGQFLISAPIREGQLKLTPNQPPLQEVAGTLVFEKNGFRVEGGRAAMPGIHITDATVFMKDFSEPKHTLHVRGKSYGSLRAYLDVLHANAGQRWFGRALAQAHGSGEVRAEGRAELHLSQWADSSLYGSVTLTGNDISLSPSLPTLTRTTGRVEFSEKGAALRNINTTFLGGHLKLDSSSLQGFQVRGEGNANLGLMGRYLNIPALEKSTGTTRYSIQLEAVNEALAWTVNTDLVGVALNLPAPLHKTSNVALPLRIQATPQGQTGREWINIALGDRISANVERHDGRLTRGHVNITDRGKKALQPQALEDLSVNIDLEKIDIDVWKKIIPGGQTEWPEKTVMNLKAKEVRWQNKRFNDIEATATRHRDSWSMKIDSPQIQGHVSWDQTANDSVAGRLVGHLTRLYLPESQSNDLIELLDTGPLQDIPALSVTVDDVQISGRLLGKLELLANHHERQQAREWQLQKLVLSHSDADLKATGSWAYENPTTRRMNLNFNLTTRNAGKTLDRLGIKNAIRDGKGTLNGQIQWHGTPFSIDMPTLKGQLNLEIKNGQFLKAEPGIARLIDVLSLQSLPKRLSLDFRDVFSAGFSFDMVSATAQLSHGIASTKDFRMSGVNATVLIEGQADLVQETQNLHVLVLPDVNAAGASVVYGLLANPVIGIGTFLAQLVLREPLSKALSREYRITGSWYDPQISNEKETSP